MKWLLSLLFVLVQCLALNGQSAWCGVDLQGLSPKAIQAAEELIQRKKQPIEKSNIVDSVAVSIHLIEGPNGQNVGNFTITEVEQEIEKVNQVFAGAGINFFICGTPRIIQGANIYDFTTGNELNRSYYIPNTINIYFANDLISNSGLGLCGYAQFPFVDIPENRYVMMNKLCSTDGATLTHELGHFYGLFHTHETRFGQELVDRSNCTTAGDRICDTPADPNLGSSSLMSGCNYIGEITDQKGASYMPPVSNYMSYAPADCQHFFTADQEKVIQDVHQQENDYITRSCDFYPDFAILQDQDFMKLRSDESINMTYQLRQLNADRGYNVVLKISLADKPEHNGTLLYKERLNLAPGTSSFSLHFDLDIPPRKGSGVYFLKAVIDADNQVIERTERNNNALTTLEIDNSELTDQTIFPNPATNELKLFLRTPEIRQDVNIRIIRYDGRLVWEGDDYKTQEEFFRILDISELQTGFYLIVINLEKREQPYTFKFFKQGG